MKSEEIQAGGLYSNGKKRESIRKVVAIIKVKHFSDEVNFEWIKGKKPSVKLPNGLYLMGLNPFAKWADHEVTCE